MRLSLTVVLAGAFAGGVLQAQQVVSAHAGVVHYVEGRVFVGDRLVERKFGQFPDLRESEELRTEDGRAEVLLTPGAFLRVADHSSVRMLSRELSDTRFEVLSGSVMVECDELLKDNAVTAVYHGTNIRLEKQGLYRLDADPPRFRVYDGKAVIEAASGQVTLKRGKEASLEGVLTASKFNPKLGDTFYGWNSTRSGYIAMANVSAAQSLLYSGTRWSTSGWMYDPWFGGFTFVPGSGIGYSPFGWNLWSPGWVVYAPVPAYRGVGYAPGIGRGIGGGNQSAGNGSSTGSGISRTGGPPAGARPGGFGGGASGGMQSGGISGGTMSGSGGMRGGGMSSGGGMRGGGSGGGRSR